jgi:hypothetical protein
LPDVSSGEQERGEADDAEGAPIRRWWKDAADGAETIAESPEARDHAELDNPDILYRVTQGRRRTP